LRIRVPAGSYLVWHNDTAYGTLLGAADNECVFLDDYSNEITMPTASDMYHVSAAVYLDGGRTYSPYITADYRTNTNTEPKQGESEGGGGGCGGFISATALAVLLLWRKR
ncbi:MAG: hypothetical protein IJQ58_12855, partial [Synergistaceae bacterium]|nr:hypothetical protein [Synergistaceae bacterium]